MTAIERQAGKQAQRSLVRGATSPPLLEDTIGVALDRAAQRWPQREALVVAHQNLRWTYAEFAARVDALAAGLLAIGLERGDRVGIWATNCAQWTLTQFATAKAGLVLVNINPSYRLSELRYTLEKVGVKALIAAEAFRSSDYVGMVETLLPGLAASRAGDLRDDTLPALRMLIKIGGAARPGWLDFETVAQHADAGQRRQLAAHAATLDRNDPINIQFTSGTTGLPKGATLSHRNILNNGYFIGASMRLREGDRLCIPVPLYHCFGMVLGNLACITHGATMVYPAPIFDPLATLQTVEAEACTALHGVPTMFIAQLAHPQFERFDLSSLRTGIMAGAPCPAEVMRRVLERMHMNEVTIAYGMTETSPVSFQSATDEPLDRRVATVGRVQPHLECKVVDRDGAIVPRGETGELCTRGYSVMLGYWDDAEKTAEAIDADGWMHTGDLATIDDDGYCCIVGRIKDMVIRGGENLYPREIEEFLYRHPKVQDVQVVGVPDAKYGEELCAWVRVQEGETLCEADMLAFCRGQISQFKIPRYWRFVDAFPMTVTGKVQKFLIREAMLRELGEN
ncbi:MAG TPA: AMP-binding protein [Solimonas sp.]|nr:AMP-binding protein [Solimonas sp.]